MFETCSTWELMFKCDFIPCFSLILAEAQNVNSHTVMLMKWLSFTGPSEKAARPSEVKDVTGDSESGPAFLQFSTSRKAFPRAVPISTTSSLTKRSFKTCDIRRSLCMILTWPNYLFLLVVFVTALQSKNRLLLKHSSLRVRHHWSPSQRNGA